MPPLVDCNKCPGYPKMLSDEHMQAWANAINPPTLSPAKEVRKEMTSLEEYVSTYVEWLPGMTWSEALALAEERDAMAAYQFEQPVLNSQ